MRAYNNVVTPPCLIHVHEEVLPSFEFSREFCARPAFKFISASRANSSCLNMPVSGGSELDCEWVVGRCKTYLERGDRHGAKAWILTARSLFPGVFTVQVGCAFIGVPIHLCVFTPATVILYRTECNSSTTRPLIFLPPSLPSPPPPPPQYEAFCLHMSCEEVKEAAMALTDL